MYVIVHQVNTKALIVGQMVKVGDPIIIWPLIHSMGTNLAKHTQEMCFLSTLGQASKEYFLSTMGLSAAANVAQAHNDA